MGKTEIIYNDVKLGSVLSHLEYLLNVNGDAIIYKKEFTNLEVNIIFSRLKYRKLEINDYSITFYK